MIKQGTLPISPRLLGGGLAILFYAAYLPPAQAADYRFGYSNRFYYPNGYYGLHDGFGLRQDMRRLDDQIQQQQLQLEQQLRQQQEQTRLLRQQQSSQQQITGMQACYYRFNGGLDVCDSLFDAAPDRHAACVEKVKEINPGCATDISKPVLRSRK